VQLSVSKKDLTTISAWPKTWLVRFSPPKTEFLIISNKTNFVHMHGSALNELSYHKHVGIILSKDLSWHKHISSSCKYGYADEDCDHYFFCYEIHKVNARLLTGLII